MRAQAALLLVLALALARPTVAREIEVQDFALGTNAEGQACRAQVRYSGVAPGRSVDVYCGEWERPSGTVYVFPTAKTAEATALLTADCPTGPAPTLPPVAGKPPPAGRDGPVAIPGLANARQVFCAEGQAGARRLGLSADGPAAGGTERVVGTAYPADWPSLVRAAQVLAGAAQPTDFSGPRASGQGETAGMAEIRAVYPDGPPGQSAAFNYTLLRRRAYENNVLWSFSASGRDFGELLRAHKQVAPDDVGGEAEILAELGLNQSDERRFEDATDVLIQAEERAAESRDPLLLSKVLNYRAINQLNQRHFRLALEFSLAANKIRSAIPGGQTSGTTFRVPSATSGARAVGRTARALLVGASEIDPQERRAVLSAQGWYLAGVSARGLNKPEAGRYLDQAALHLGEARQPPAWLSAQIAGERARLRLASHDPGGAEQATAAGLEKVRASQPGTRAEAHLLLLQAQAETMAGRPAGERLAARQAVALFARQRETPGMPPDVAAAHLEALLTDWYKDHDPAIAAEYFETLALVWDGAAARSASQLAARLATKEASGEARSYQDAERRYRASLAARQRLALASAPPEETRPADAEVDNASKALAAAEAKLRSASPRYTELLKPTATAAALQAVLAPEEGYLRVVSGSDAGYGALVTREGVTPYRIAAGEPALDALVASLRKTTQYKGRRLPDYDMEAAQALYAAVIAPVAEPIAKLKRLEVDAGGPLAAAPFAAFVETAPSPEIAAKIAEGQDYSGVAWLARRVALSSAVGPASFISLRKSKAASGPVKFAGFGDFQRAPKLVAARLAVARQLSPRCRAEVEQALNRLPALPETGEEARSAAALFGANATLAVGDAFTDELFLTGDKVRDASVLLLATHGVLGLSSCFAEPALLTSLGPKGSGLIEASELLDRRLNARLVIMSACDTAGGAKLDAARTGLTDGGEALSGLARAFLYAGATDVLATQWKVDSATSGQQVQSLLASALRGQPLADALSAAQRKSYENAETTHPFFWSGFVLIGDGGATLQGGAAPTLAAK